jgi:membrane protein implicated in regulation of membrane protease activity
MEGEMSYIWEELIVVAWKFLGGPLFIFLLLVALAFVYVGLIAQRRPRSSGLETMIGETGLVKTGPRHRGRHSVEVRGERWWCESASELRPGMEVRVTAVKDDMVLEVEPI